MGAKQQSRKGMKAQQSSYTLKSSNKASTAEVVQMLAKQYLCLSLVQKCEVMEHAGCICDGNVWVALGRRGLCTLGSPVRDRGLWCFGLGSPLFAWIEVGRKVEDLTLYGRLCLYSQTTSVLTSSIK
jgi:hypothetical protein